MPDLYATVAVPGYPATWSPCHRYRYTLWRRWTTATRPRYLMVIGLNPSTATETDNDPTVRRCIGFAQSWGYDALCMCNLFAWRSTDPNAMKRVSSPVGHSNDDWLRRCAWQASLILAAWGTHGSFRQRATTVTRLIPSGLYCLDTNRDGSPRHPLYAPANRTPQRWLPPATD